MAAITRNDLNANILQTWLYRQTLEVFEPQLYFHKYGTKPTVPGGYNTVSWAKFDQIAASSVTTGTTSNDGVTPNDTDFDATVITATPVQYRIVVNLSDQLIQYNVIAFVEGALKAIGDAMARKIDTVIQTTIMAGDNVIYADPANNSARTDLAATDVLTAQLLNRSNAFLMNKNAPTFDGSYVAVAHPYQIFDLRSETGTGNWLDVNKYVTADKIFKGEIGMLNGVRVVQSQNVQTFSSTVTVYPCLVLGSGAYGVTEWQSLKVYTTPMVASDSDPLAQRMKVGAKMAFATTILQQNAMVRVETGATNIG